MAGHAISRYVSRSRSSASCFRPAAPRTTRHRPHPRHAGRQDRAEPADERDAGGDGAGALQVVVRGLRPRPRQGRRPRPRPAQAPRRPLPGFLRGLGAGGDSEGVGGEVHRRPRGRRGRNHAEHQGAVPIGTAGHTHGRRPRIYRRYQFRSYSTPNVGSPTQGWRRSVPGCCRRVRFCCHRERRSVTWPSPRFRLRSIRASSR